MTIQTRPLTVEQFDQLAGLPENADRQLEYIGGEIVEMVSNSYASTVAANVLILVGGFVRTHQLGHVTGADGGYRVAGERYIPDVAFISAHKQPHPSREAYNPNPPDLAVEVLSPSNDLGLMRFKVVGYLSAGTTVWVVDPDKKQVEVYVPGQTPRRVGLDGVVEGGDVLPGFSLAVKDIFPAE